ncbi:MAG: hypothetical protein CMJ42_21595 [Phyllobacteriaceae bacterium]|nr:hypothetical protein [Phyllobacteriaceae bacterium]MBA93132.1 hypothetical protein [Phyllobacteriaceae bacterium]
MRGTAFLFVATAALFVTIGMAWGIQMSASGNHMLAGAHAHLNLVGWVTMGLFGFYYHLVPTAGERMLAKVHYAVATLGVVTIVPGIVMAITQQGETLAKIGSVLTILSMLIFLYTVVTTRARPA